MRSMTFRLSGGHGPRLRPSLDGRRNWRYDSHRAMKTNVYRLGREYGDNSIVSGFATAEKFQWNFYHDSMEPYEIEDERPIVHRFVERISALVGAEG